VKINCCVDPNKGIAGLNPHTYAACNWPRLVVPTRIDSGLPPVEHAAVLDLGRNLVNHATKGSPKNNFPDLICFSDWLIDPRNVRFSGWLSRFAAA
jgi:hypothetical protein